MRICIITGGPNIDPIAADLALECDKVLCADSGADFAFDNHVMPEIIYGDLDSISEEGKMRIDDLNIPVEVFPCEKDMTDTELVLSTIDKSDEILLVCSLSGRIDHVMANLQIALRMHSEGYKIALTDGITDVYPMCGEDELSIDSLLYPENVVVSLVPSGMDQIVEGVTTSGLYYPLDNASINGGSSFSISNKLQDGATAFSVKIRKGNMLVVTTDDRM